MTTTDYGIDVSTFPDLDDSGRNISGARVLAETYVRRITTPPGTLAYADFTDSIDIREALSAAYGSGDLDGLAGALKTVGERDERIESVDVTLQVLGDEHLVASVTLTPIEGEPFSLTVDINQMNVTLLD